MISALVLAVVLSTNPWLTEGEAAFDALDYAKAEARLKLAVESSTSTPDELRKAYDLLARARLAQGQTAKAEEAYAQLLARDPLAPAPVEAAPRVKQAYLNAKMRLFPKPGVRLRALSTAGAEVVLEVFDPWALVASVSFEGGATLAVSAGLARGPSSPQKRTVLAVDGSGAELARLEVAGVAVARVEAPAAAVEVPKEQPPSAPQVTWPVWTAAAVTTVALAAGIGLSIASVSDSRAAPEQKFASDIRALDESARSKALASQVLFGVAAAGGAGTVVLVFTLP